MAHDIFNNRFVDTETENGRVAAWHKLGKVIDKNLSPLEAGREAGALYKVEKLPIEYTYNGVTKQVDDQFILVREPLADDPMPREFGTVGNRYSVVQNETIFRLLEPLAEHWKINTLGVLGTGDRMFVQFEIGQHEVAGIDPVRLFFIVLNQFTTRNAILPLISTVRVVCANTLDMALKDNVQKMLIPHNKDAEQDFMYATIMMAEAIKANQEVIDSMELMAHKMLAKPESPAQSQQEALEAAFNTMLAAVFPEPTKPRKMAMAERFAEDVALQMVKARYEQELARTLDARSQVRELFLAYNDTLPTPLQGTQWAGVNAVTEWADHKFERQTSDDSLSTVIGARATIKQRAYEYVRALK